MSQPIKLFGHYDSGHVYKVMLFLELAKIPYEFETVDIWAEKNTRSREFLDSSRNGEVPCLVMGGNSYIQSNLILHTLARKYQCFGGENEQRLLATLDWLFWESNRLGMSLPQLRYARSFAPEKFNQDSLAFIRSRFDEDISLLAKQLSKGHTFVLDNQPSIADFSLCGYLYWADEAAVELPEPVTRWLNDIRTLDGWQSPYTMMKKD